MITLPSSTCSLPLLFAQVREDPLQEERLLRDLGPAPRLMMIASGGCTAAYLAGKSLAAEIHLVDAAPAQVALTRLKLALLQAPPSQRRALLGWSPTAPEDRLAGLGQWLAPLGLQPGDLGPEEVLAASGPDFCGRYEVLFAALRQSLEPFRHELEELLCGRREYAPGALSAALRRSCEVVFDLELLQRLFGPAATQQARQSFAAHFFQRLELALSEPGRSQNPWLHSILKGPAAAFPPPWLELPQTSPRCRITSVQATMSEALRQAQNEGRLFDLIQLSNILDWLAPDEALALLEFARPCLAPGGKILIRQLNSRLEIPSLSPHWRWRPAPASLPRLGDRSFFYPAILVGAPHAN
ncbi:MAG: hypothetical protein RL095_40 [Verrucomicrobiota bacterium]|jgi:S-adenosylmethionine-diacylglycerol 3-amino-3-carboxypropyl transferase